MACDTTKLWCTVTEFRAYRFDGEAQNFGDLTNDDLCEALLRAQEYVEQYTGQRWGTYTEMKCFDGNCEEALFFTGDPAISITLVTVEGGICCGSNTTTITDYKNYRTYLDLGCASACCYDCGKDCGRKWTKGCMNVCVTATWGHEMPALVKKALFLIASKELGLGNTGCSDFPDGSVVKRIKYPDYEIEFHQPEGPQETTGVAEADAILDNFVKTGITDMFVLPEQAKSQNLCDPDGSC